MAEAAKKIPEGPIEVLGDDAIARAFIKQCSPHMPERLMQNPDCLLGAIKKLRELKPLLREVRDLFSKEQGAEIKIGIALAAAIEKTIGTLSIHLDSGE